MKILVTGVSGLLGINIALEAAQHHDVVGIVNRHPLITQAFSVQQADLRTPGTVERLVDSVQPDWVIHCAALANLEACEKDPQLAGELNIELPRKLARYVARGGARLLHVSTDAVFDGVRGNYAEEDEPNPLSVYAQTKLAGERAVHEVNPAAIIARVNLFGWSLLGQRSLAEFFFYNLKAGYPVKGFTDVYFCPLLANDMAQIFLKMLAKRLSGLYHVFSNDSMSKYAFGVEIARIFALNPERIAPIPVSAAGLQAARSPNLTMRVDKLIRDLDETPPTISTGLEQFSRLYQQGYPQMLKKMVKAEW
ncbi:MAG: SDR family oxidoreductase [Anaerolineae bacterium]|nr:SDR family oxidoreductase [Anaerolineae bacterium]MBC8332847.1 SDR family oxidoreductase [Anaerolineae bacterium]